MWKKWISSFKIIYIDLQVSVLSLNSYELKISISSHLKQGLMAQGLKFITQLTLDYWSSSLPF